MLWLSLGIPACDQSPTPQEAAAATALSRRIDENKRRDLLKSYRRIHDRGDVDSFVKLVYLEGADPDTVESFIASFEADRKLPVLDVVIVPIKKDDVLEYERSGVIYAPNLPPVGWLKVIFDTASDAVMATNSTQYLLGMKDGQYRIITSKPK